MMFLMRGGRINQGQGCGGRVGKKIYIIPQEIIVLFRNVKFIRG
jgi:hypothetical protein